MLGKNEEGKSQLQKCLMTPWQTQCYWKILVFLSLESQPVVLVLKTFFYFLSGSLSLMLNLAESIWFWNGFQQHLTQRIWIRSVIQDKSSTSALDEWTLARLIIDSFLCVQVLQFYSRQSYQNKAVPSAGLLFVFIEQANGLPVSILSSMYTEQSMFLQALVIVNVGYLCFQRLRRVAKSQKWEPRSLLEKCPIKPQ